MKAITFIKAVGWFGKLVPVFVAGFILAFLVLGVLDTTLLILGVAVSVACYYMSCRVLGSLEWQLKRKK